MSLRNSIAANYAGVVITTILTFLVVPFYFKWLGSDAYGLVGIASMVQSWLMLLNAGLSPVVGRQAAQAHAGTVDWERTARFFRTVDWVVAGLSCAALLAVSSGSAWLAQHWLKTGRLPADTVSLGLILLTLNVLVRLSTSISNGILMNMEQQVWQNGNMIVFSLLRFAASLPLIWFWPSVEVLFGWWVLVSLVEYVSIRKKITWLLPVKVSVFLFDMKQLQQHGKMAATLAFTSTVWVLITNLDKLVLSGILPLANYGYYSIATLLAGGVLVLAQPVTQAFQPRLTKAYAQGGVEAACIELRRCTQLVVLITFPVGAVLFAMPEVVLFVWTGNHTVAANAANVLRGYVLGNTLIAAGGLLYLLQVAIGNVRWHLRGNVIFALVLVPTIPWMAKHFGAEGAAWLWATINLLLFIGWNSILLRKLAPDLHFRWLLQDTLAPLMLALCVASLMVNSFFPILNDRLWGGLAGVLTGTVTALIVLIFISTTHCSAFVQLKILRK